jgi:hypothetical protein
MCLMLGNVCKIGLFFKRGHTANLENCVEVHIQVQLFFDDSG